MSWSRLMGGVALPVLALAMAVPAYAQSVSSSIRGTVVDVDGFSVPDAQVEITDTRTGRTTSTTTGAGGFFTATGLDVGGPYSILVRATNYKTAQQNNVNLTLGEASRITITMEVADAATGGEQVIVTAERPNQEIDSRGVGYSANAEVINATPTINRDFKDVIQLNPLAFVDLGTSEGRTSIAGSNPRCNSFLVDGMPQNDSFGLNTGGYPTARSPLPFDFAKQVQVAVSPYDTEYNDFCGGVVNVVTKTGSNQLDGSLYYYYKDLSMIGKESGNVSLSRSSFIERNWGATVSGPLIEDTLFFFLGYDETKRQAPFSIGPGVTARPGPANQTGPFANSVFGITQGDITAVSAIAQTVYGFDAGSLDAAFPETNTRWMAKLNWNINDQHRAQVSYQESEGTQFAGGNLPTIATNPATQASVLRLPHNWYLNAQSLTSMTGQVFSDWTDNFSTEFRIGRVKVDGTPRPISGGRMPEFWVRTTGADGVANNGDDSYIVLGTDFSRQFNRLSYQFDIIKFNGTYTLNDHVIKFGVEHKRLSFFNAFVQGANGSYRFDNCVGGGCLDTFDNFRRGIVASTADTRTNVNARDPIGYTNATTNNPEDAAARWSYRSNTVYIQDDWDVSPELAIMAGIRFDWYHSDPNAIRLNTTTPQLALLGLAGFFETYGFANTKTLDGLNILLPRLSFSYKVPEFDDWKLTVRGGVGRYSGGQPNVWVSNNYQNDGITLATVQGNPGGAVNPTIAGFPQVMPAAAGLFGPGPTFNMDGFVPASLQALVTARAPYASATVNALDPNFKIPNLWRFNIGLDAEWNGYKALVEVMGMVARDQLFYQDLRMTESPALQAPDAALGRKRYVPTAGRPVGTGAGNRDLVLRNTDQGRALYIILGGEKTWDFENGRIKANIAYTYSDVRDLGYGLSSVAASNFTNRAYLNINDNLLSRSDFERRHRVTGGVNFAYDFFGFGETRLNFFGARMSGQPFSYTFGGNANAAFGANQNNGRSLFYVPQTDATGVVTATSDPRVIFTSGGTGAGTAVASAGQLAALNTFLQDTGLIRYAGQIAPRNEFFTERSFRVDAGFEQDVVFYDDYKITFEFDIFNLTNLLNKNWGRFESANFPYTASVLDSFIVNNGAAPFGGGPVCANASNCYAYNIQNIGGTVTPGANTSLADPGSFWQIQLGVRLEF